MPQILKQPSISVFSSLSMGHLGMFHGLQLWNHAQVWRHGCPDGTPEPNWWVKIWGAHHLWSWSILILTSTQMLELHDDIYVYIYILRIWICPMELFMERLVRSATLCMFFNPTEVEMWLEDINQLHLNSSLVDSTLCQYVSFGFIRNYASPFLAGWFTQLSWWYAAAARNYLILAVWCRKMWAREYGWDMVRPFMREASDAEAPRIFLFISGMMEEIWRNGVHYFRYNIIQPSRT